MTTDAADLAPLRRALISVSDKAGLLDFAKGLSERGVELLSTGGTSKMLRDAGLSVRDVADLTGFPEMMDGRVKTLHPKVHGGLLALRDNAGHVAAMKEHGIEPIDLLVVNLYPFEATVAKGRRLRHLRREYRHRRPRDDPRGGEKPRACGERSWIPRTTPRSSATSTSMVARPARSSAASWPSDAYARTAAYDAAVSNWMATGHRRSRPAPPCLCRNARPAAALRREPAPIGSHSTLMARPARASPPRPSIRARS